MNFIKRSTAFIIIFMVLVASFAIHSFGSAEEAAPEYNSFTKVKELDGKRIGVLTGTTSDAAVSKYLKNAQAYEYNSVADLALALENGKVDAYCASDPFIKYSICTKYHNHCLIDDALDTEDYAAAFPKKSPKTEKLKAQYDSFLESLEANGSLEKIRDAWINNDVSKQRMSTANIKGKNGTLKVAICSSLGMPFCFLGENNVVKGLDLDLMARFCQKYGYGMKIDDYNFTGLIDAASIGKCDVAVGCITITEERKEKITFSRPNYNGSICLTVKSNGKDLKIKNLSELNGKKVSVAVGTIYEQIVRDTSYIKDPEVCTYQSVADSVLAVSKDKAEAVALDLPIAKMYAASYNNLKILPQGLLSEKFSFIFPKGSDRVTDFNNCIEKFKQDGTIDRLEEKWCNSSSKKEKKIPVQDWPGSNGVLKCWTTPDLEPITYVSDGEIVGFDVEILLRIAKELDYKVKFYSCDFPGVLNAVESGKADIAIGAVTMTEERKERVDFCEPYYNSNVVLLVRKVKTDNEVGVKSFFTERIEKTFIKEGRWKLFVGGIFTTLLITVSSIIFGTILGFLLYLPCRSGKGPFAKVVNIFAWFIHGVPVVVLLMILYYIIFGKVDISGVAVAVIGFTFIFGIAMYGMIKTGVGAIDKGQFEAAYALGLSKNQTFFKVILPQAAMHFMPIYKDEVVTLIKGTAVVGYIAVQDLTKVSDIVRSRTYEAIFSLLSTAVIYFILSEILTFFVKKIIIAIDTKNRSRSKILKGINYNDRD